jgi:F-type H+-transporting ATPase subunit b
MDSLIGTFHIDWKLIVAQLINFAIVFFVLYRFALKPLGKLMDERKNTIETGLTDAKRNKELLEEAKVAYDAELSKARREGAEIASLMKEDIEKKRVELLARAESDAKNLIEETHKKLEEDKAKILRDAEKEIASLVMSATEKVLGAVAVGKVQEELVEKSIKDSK